MSKKLDSEFIKQLQPGECKQKVFFLYGDDAFAVEQCRVKLRSLLPEEDVLVMRDWEFSIDEAIDFLTTVSFLPTEKVLDIRNADIDGLSEGDVKRLLRLLEQAEQTYVLFSFTSVSPATKKNGHLMTLLTKLSDQCGYVELKKRTSAQLEDFVFSYVQERKGKISRKLAKYIVENTENDPLFLSMEMDKLLAYGTGREITMQMIDTMLTKSVEASVFHIADRLTSQRLGDGLSILHTLLEKKEDPQKIMGAFAVSFMDAYRCKVATANGVSISDVMEAYGIASEFRMKKGQQLAAKLSYNCLRDCVRLIVETDRSLKTGAGVDAGLLLELLLANIAVRLEAERRRVG